MELRDAILAAISLSENSKIIGKKRLQKIIHLLSVNNDNFSVDFKIHHYGPFSRDLADEVEELILVGDVEQGYEKGHFGMLISAYSVNPDADLGVDTSIFGDKFACLNSHDTTELEIISTIAFFMQEDQKWNIALSKTREFKPKKFDEEKISSYQQALKKLQILQ